MTEWLLGLDLRVLSFVHPAHATGAVPWAMWALSAIGSGWSLLAALPLLAIERLRRWTLTLVASVLVTAALVFALKSIVRRPRPQASVAGLRTLVVKTPIDFSFPSGHAAGSFAVAGFGAVALLAKRRRIEGRTTKRALLAGGIAGLASGVALSRVYLGVHFPSDVVAGAALGATVGILGGLRLQRRGVPSSDHDLEHA